MKKTFKTIISAIISLACLSSLAIINVSADTDIDSAVMYGDATCNNEVDIRDITAVNQHIVKLNILSEQGIKNCDLYGTGDVTIKDIGQIKKYIINAVDKLETINETNQKQDFTDSAFIAEGGLFNGSKAFTSVEELEAEESLGLLWVLNKEKYNEEFFNENVLYIASFQTTAMAENYLNVVWKNKEGDFTAYVDEFSEWEGSSIIIDGWCVYLIIPKSEYSGQELTVNVDEIHICPGTF